jgi:fatty-acyl-CoA synthase
MDIPLHAANLLPKRTELTPDRVALVELETKQRYTYAELNTRANRLANFMRDKLGVEAGDRVSILARNSVVYLDLLFGLPKIGAIFSPFNWRLTAHELSYMVNDLNPKVIICEAEFTEVLYEMLPEIDVEHFISLRDAAIDSAWEYETELALASPAEPPYPDLTLESPYAILYTSGTTGYPKGAIIPHRQVLFNAINTVISWGLSEKDVSPVYTPMFHAGGLFVFLIPLFYAGGRIVLARDFDPEASLAWILEEGCTVVLAVPTLFQMWMDSPYFEKADLGNVHFFISGGAACPIPLMQAWREKKGIVFRQGYGLTEAGVNCFTMTDEDSVRKSGSVGKPIFHAECRIIDPDTGEEVAPGVAGELLISGPHVTSGYWRNPQATAESIKDGWLHTGDMAHRDEEGFYYIDGRYKDMIKSGGENIYAAEVEAVIRDHPGVRDAALIGLPDDKWGEVGLIVVVPEGDPISKEELIEFCSGKLARFKIPKAFEFADELPYSAYGKVEKIKLKEIYLSDQTDGKS